MTLPTQLDSSAGVEGVVRAAQDGDHRTGSGWLEVAVKVSAGRQLSAAAVEPGGAVGDETAERRRSPEQDPDGPVAVSWLVTLEAATVEDADRAAEVALIAARAGLLGSTPKPR